MATILVTGCDTGLGVEFARQYAVDGHRVIATCLDPGGARETGRIRGNIEVVKLDVTDHAAIDALSHQLAKEPIDILLNNAGIGRRIIHSAKRTTHSGRGFSRPI
jgi:NAD(P)-dependent dehydrogenase (short-subunit alcohol dehydrogenase family)